MVMEQGKEREVLWEGRVIVMGQGKGREILWEGRVIVVMWVGKVMVMVMVMPKGGNRDAMGGEANGMVWKVCTKIRFR